MSTTYTENYNLGKQTNTADKFDMSIITDNMDKIDHYLKENAEEIDDTAAAIYAALSALTDRVAALEASGGGGNYSITVLWDYNADNNGTIPYDTFTGTLHDNINNYDAIQLEIVSAESDLSDSNWDSTTFSKIIPVYVLNNSLKNNYFTFTSFGERSSRWYIKNTTIQKTTRNLSNTNGLVRVYGIKF